MVVTQAAIQQLLGIVARMTPQLAFIAFIVAAMVFFGQRFGFFGDTIQLAPTSAANLVAGEGREVELFTLLPKDGIRSIDEPKFLAAADAEWSLSTPVIGLQINGDTRAYPLLVMASHEIVNDVVGGQAVAVIYCPLCLTGIVFDRGIDGRVVEFGVSGKLLMNVLVMYDRGTDSLWSQILREGITGPHKGTSLTVIDSLQTTWGTWRDLHPDSLILNAALRNDSYASYYRNNDAGVHGESISDERLPTKAVVVGLVVGRTARAYPLALAAQAQVINDVVEAIPVVTVFGTDGVTGVVYDRRLADRELLFDPHATDSLAMIDRETGSVWNRFSGAAVSGPLRGSVLRRMPATNSFWFGWHDFYPQTTVYGVDAPGTQGLLDQG